MLKCHLSKIMGEKRLKMSDVSRDTGINPGTIRRMFNETATRVELSVVETLCEYLEVEVGELYELPEKNVKTNPEE
ncbi:MAG: helix-turn-helix domain-containing protein [Psychromonas sp.]